jgi:sugar lactone lactonase YvrE
LTFTGTAGNALNLLNNPNYITMDQTSGILYISDTGNHRIMQYLPGATSGTIVAGGNGAGLNTNQLDSPTGVYFDSSSNSLIIANWNSNNVVRWILGASNWTLLAGSINGTAGNTSTLLKHPEGVLLDPLGNLYVSDQANNRVQFFQPGQSNGTTIAGITDVGGSAPNLLSSPYGLGMDNQFNLYVADSGNNRIMKFRRL